MAQPGRPSATPGSVVTGWGGRNRYGARPATGFNAGFDVSVSPLWPGGVTVYPPPPGPNQPRRNTPGQPPPCNCGGSSTGPVTPPPFFPPPPPVFPPVNPAPPNTSTGTCLQCGSNANGCATVSRFAFNSSDLNSQQTQQTTQIAREIFDKKINAVIATGHTDSRGTEQ